jgi:hypothetical protein
MALTLTIILTCLVLSNLSRKMGKRGTVMGGTTEFVFGWYACRDGVGTMLRRRRSRRKKQLRLKLSVRDAEGCRS